MVWVRLTTGTIAAVDKVVPDSVREELSFERRLSGERTVYIHAAFVAWELTRDLLAQQAFSSTGAKAKGVPYPLSQALRKVTAATNEVIKHPALRETAMLGHHAHTFPVWELTLPDEFKRRWWPSPIEGAHYCVLKPTWHDDGGRRLTTWGEHGIEYRADRLNEEAVHWRVLRR